MRSQVISFHCVLTNQVGELISSTFNRDVSTESEGPGAFLQGLAAGLRGVRPGEKRRICLSAKDAYGLYDPKLVVELERADLKEGRSLKLGDEVEARIDGGQHQTFRVIRVSGVAVTLDANHPLAGQDLIFDIDATEVRDATNEDGSGLRHGPGNTFLH